MSNTIYNIVKKGVLYFVFLSGLLIITTSMIEAKTAGEEICNTAPTSQMCIDYKKSKDRDPVVNTISAAVKLFSSLAGVLAVIYVIFGGFKYITSAGEPQKAASGRQTIIYGLVGLVVVVISQQLILFVLNQFK